MLWKIVEMYQLYICMNLFSSFVENILRQWFELILPEVTVRTFSNVHQGHNDLYPKRQVSGLDTGSTPWVSVELKNLK